MDHRGLQRTLFRMQADPKFARALLDGKQEAVTSTGLAPDDLELLIAARPEALAADPGNRRRMQVLGNTASEFMLSLAAAGGRGELGDFLDAFLGAPEFHRAMARGERLPLAFAAYGLRRADETGAEELKVVLRLEEALARLRRGATGGGETRVVGANESTSIPSPHPPGEDRGKGRLVSEEIDEIGGRDESAVEALQLAPGAVLLELPAGSLAWSEALRDHLNDQREGLALPRCPGFDDSSSDETILLWADSARSAYSFPEVHAERLAPPADRLFQLARSPLSRSDRARFAREAGAEPEELDRFMESFVEMGALQRVGGLALDHPRA